MINQTCCTAYLNELAQSMVLPALLQRDHLKPGDERCHPVRRDLREGACHRRRGQQALPGGGDRFMCLQRVGYERGGPLRIPGCQSPDDVGVAGRPVCCSRDRSVQRLVEQRVGKAGVGIRYGVCDVAQVLEAAVSVGRAAGFVGGERPQAVVQVGVDPVSRSRVAQRPLCAAPGEFRIVVQVGSRSQLSVVRLLPFYRRSILPRSAFGDARSCGVVAPSHFQQRSL
ncbi:hypothetical protein [Streptomyces sp. NPDC056468]|uniref:hypothetical protein n=1 Tax=Streptomyces sp. NPDC056468 TaxID=3345830 RepID=UPI0036B93D49